jgi:hypothetical protein
VRRRNVLCAGFVFAAACASGGSSGAPAPTPDSGNVERINSPWPVATRMHIDLWLHGFAMLQADTTLIPFFERGYADRIDAIKQRANVESQLDLNRQQLRQRLTISPTIISAQFLAMQASSLDNLLNAAELFLRAEGDAREQPGDATGDRDVRAVLPHGRRSGLAASLSDRAPRRE